MYLSEAIKVLIIVIFRVFFDDDNKMMHFFRGGKLRTQKTQFAKISSNQRNITNFNFTKFRKLTFDQFQEFDEIFANLI